MTSGMRKVHDGHPKKLLEGNPLLLLLRLRSRYWYEYLLVFHFYHHVCLIRYVMPMFTHYPVDYFFTSD